MDGEIERGMIIIVNGRKKILWRGLAGRIEEVGLKEGDGRREDFCMGIGGGRILGGGCEEG